MIVAQARLPVFYTAYDVPDTVNGRFDMLVLHLWLVLRRLRAESRTELAQALFDHFSSDLDANLREMGVGDLAVPRRMRRFGEAFYGRAQAYDAAVAASDPQALTQALVQALARNILRRADPAAALPLAAYVRRAIADLARMADGAIGTANWAFPAPDPVMDGVPPTPAVEASNPVHRPIP
jgi:cytochrome b pre-mRNA-processing protein 3